MKILIVEDEQDLRETIRTSLLKEKFVVETAADYFSALDKINDYDYDCILLDIMLPGGSGLDLLRELKRLHRSDSVLIISAKDSLDDKVDGLELGADDYQAFPSGRTQCTCQVIDTSAAGEGRCDRHPWKSFALPRQTAGRDKRKTLAAEPQGVRPALLFCSQPRPGHQ